MAPLKRHDTRPIGKKFDINWPALPKSVIADYEEDLTNAHVYS